MASNDPGRMDTQRPPADPAHTPPPDADSAGKRSGANRSGGGSRGAGAAPGGRSTTAVGRRGTLSRERILHAALTVADTAGVDALTMRRVATELGVDPMALYRHVASKDALLDGVVETLWREVPRPERRGDEWAEQLRGFAFALRGVVRAHPSAAPLLLTRCVMCRPALDNYAVLLDNLRDAGFDDMKAAQILRTVTSTALGDALAALSYSTLTGRSAEPAGSEDVDAWIALSQALPQDIPPALVRTAYAVCACEPDADFAFVLDLILQGAQDLKR